MRSIISQWAAADDLRMLSHCWQYADRQLILIGEVARIQEQIDKINIMSVPVLSSTAASLIELVTLVLWSTVD